MENYQQSMPNGTIVQDYPFWTPDGSQMVHQYPLQCNGAAPYDGYSCHANGYNSWTPAHDSSMLYPNGQQSMDAMPFVPPFYGSQVPYANMDFYQPPFAALPPVPELPLVDPYQPSAHQAPNGVHYRQYPSSVTVQNAPKTSGAISKFPTTPVQNHPILPPGKIVVTLKNEQEWMKYHKETNEMFILNGGRPLFPVLVYEVKGLEAMSNYCVSIHLRRTSVGQMKYVEARKQWEENGKQDVRPENPTEIFYENKPGVAWEKSGISFRHTKIYNVGNDKRKAVYKKKLTDEKKKLKTAEEKSKTMLQVNSLAKYLPVLRIYKVDSKDEKQLVEEKSFPETEFVTVTEYKNQWISLHKTLDNPSTKSEYKENARALIEKENYSPGSSTSSGSSSGYGSPSEMASGSSDASPPSGADAVKSRKTRRAPTAKNPRAAKALKLSEPMFTSSGAHPGCNGYMY